MWSFRGLFVVSIAILLPKFLLAGSQFLGIRRVTSTSAKKVSKVVGRRLQDKWQCWCREGWEEKKFFFKCHHLVFLLLVSENRTMTITSTKNVKIEPINTTRAWNEEQRKKIWLSDRNQTLDLPNTGQVWFLSGTQMFSLFHARVMLITSLFTFHYRA